MKKKTLKLCFKTGLVALLTATVACSSDDNSLNPVKPPVEVPEVKDATVSLKVSGFTQSTIELQIDSKDAKKVFYYVEMTDQAADITAQKVMDLGVIVKENSPQEIIVSDLKPNAKYAVTALALNSEDKVTMLATPEIIQTLQSGVIEVKTSQVEAKSATVSFKMANLEKASYILAKHGEQAPTSQEVVDNGVVIDKLEGESEVLFEDLDPQTKYQLFVAGLEASGKYVMESIEFTTQQEAPVDNSIVFSEIRVSSESQGWLNVYVLELKNQEWEAGFEIGSIDFDQAEFPTGKFYYASWSDEVSADGVGKYFIKNVKTSEDIRDLDQGTIIITKTEDGNYDIVFDITRDRGPEFKAKYSGPVTVTPY